MQMLSADINHHPRRRIAAHALSSTEELIESARSNDERKNAYEHEDGHEVLSRLFCRATALQDALGALELAATAGRKPLACPIDEVLNHADSRAGALRRYIFARHRAGDPFRRARERPCRWMGRIGCDTMDPAFRRSFLRHRPCNKRLTNNIPPCDPPRIRSAACTSTRKPRYDMHIDLGREDAEML